MTGELSAKLSPEESAQLAANEKIIREGLQSFLDVGTALQRIRDGRLYRLRYATFAEYCDERWRISRPRAYELMNAALVVSAIADKNPDLPAVSRESQARELAKVPESARAEVWREANEQTGGAPTAAVVRDIREARSPLPGERIRPIIRPMTAASPSSAAADPVASVARAIETMIETTGVVPDRDYAQWRKRFMDAIAGSFRTVAFSDEDVALYADDQLVDEFGRLIRTLSEKHARVVEARRKPSNVVHLRAV